MISTQSFRVALIAGLTWAASQFFVTWAFGNGLAFFYEATGEIIDPMLLAFLNNLIFMPAAVGVMAGYVTVVLLRNLSGLRSLPSRTIITVSVLALFLGAVALFPASRLFPRFNYWNQSNAGINPTVGFTNVLLPAFGDGFFTWALPGVLIGYAIASAIKQHGMNLNAKQTALIVAGWGVGFAVGGGLWLAGIDGMSIWITNMNSFPQVVRDILGLLPYAMLGFFAGLIGMWLTLHSLIGRATLPNTV